MLSICRILLEIANDFYYFCDELCAFEGILMNELFLAIVGRDMSYKSLAVLHSGGARL